MTDFTGTGRLTTLNFTAYSRGKDKVVPTHAMKAYKNKSIAQLILNPNRRLGGGFAEVAQSGHFIEEKYLLYLLGI